MVGARRISTKWVISLTVICFANKRWIGSHIITAPPTTFQHEITRFSELGLRRRLRTHFMHINHHET
ncbi:hypothetical protein D9M71_114570 [compost metagenome]